jgi:hypothetical protein
MICIFVKYELAWLYGHKKYVNLKYANAYEEFSFAPVNFHIFVHIVHRTYFDRLIHSFFLPTFIIIVVDPENSEKIAKRDYIIKLISAYRHTQIKHLYCTDTPGYFVFTLNTL